jgi:predicted nuclease of restriction endonuclease-like (RecB) superfamily
MKKQLEKSFVEVVGLIKSARHKAYRAVNTVLIDLYWQVGEYVAGKVENDGWGKAVVEELAGYLERTQPDVRGFSASNIWRMKQFFETYRDSPKLAALLRELTWTHNILILGKCRLPEEREFYIRLVVKEKYSRRELERQIKSCLFERTLLSKPKLAPVVRELYPEAAEVFRDTYVLDFLDLPASHSEKDLQNGLVMNLRKFIMEAGRDLCFVGQEFPLQVGQKDFFVDLLFFHRGLQCLVAFEIKIDDFKPEYLGQLSFYLEALDRKVRKPHEKPSVGILLCKSKDEEVVEFALNRTLSPALVAEYRMRLPDKALLQQKLHEFYELETGRRRKDRS